jgi:hypothetical protein
MNALEVGAGPFWVKTRIPQFEAYVSFRQLRTCLPHWLGPLSAKLRHTLG